MLQPPEKRGLLPMQMRASTRQVNVDRKTYWIAQCDFMSSFRSAGRRARGVTAYPTRVGYVALLINLPAIMGSFIREGRMRLHVRVTYPVSLCSR